MPWQKAGITQDNLLQAMERCDRSGIEAFRQACHPGFKAAKGKRVLYRGRGPYEPRPLIAAAYALRHPDAPALGPKAFSGDSARQTLIRRHGFVLEGEGEAEPAARTGAASPPVAESPPGSTAGVSADAQRDELQEVEARIAHLEQRLAIARTARAVYAQALRDALQDVSLAPVNAWRKRPGRKRWGKGAKRA